MSSRPPLHSAFKPLKFICTHCGDYSRKFEYIFSGETLYARGCFKCYFPYDDEDMVEWMNRHRMRFHHPERLNEK